MTEHSKSHIVRQASYADMPTLFDLVRDELAKGGTPLDDEELSSRILPFVSSSAQTALFSDQCFAFGANYLKTYESDATIASFSNAHAPNGSWPSLVWAAEAWAQSVGADQLNFSVKASDAQTLKEMEAMGFEVETVTVSRPIRSFKDIEQKGMKQ